MLRKLTLKSKIKFGKYSDLTVFELININKTQYLQWCYFCNSDIDFFSDVLDLIKIEEKYRFKKPNKNEILYEEFKKEKEEKIFGLNKIIKKRKINANLKGERVGKRKRDNIYFSKSNLAARNRGNYK